MKEGLALIENMGGQTGNKKEELFKIERKKKKEECLNEIMRLRDIWYEKDVELNSDNRNILPALRRHNKIVQQYGEDLITLFKSNGTLNELQAEIAKIAITLHDCGKIIANDILKHHEEGIERARIILEELQQKNKKIKGVNLSATIEVKGQKINIQEKILQAINRHMNHPYLINLNKGERFPEPQDLIDEIVFDADMLANIGFKNVAFQLASDKDSISQIQKVFDEVVKGAEKLPDIMKTEEAKEIGKKLKNKLRAIYENLDFDKIQEKLKGNKMSNQQIIDFLNKKIKKAGEKVSQQEIENFLI